MLGQSVKVVLCAGARVEECGLHLGLAGDLRSRLLQGGGDAVDGRAVRARRGDEHDLLASEQVAQHERCGGLGERPVAADLALQALN